MLRNEVDSNEKIILTEKEWKLIYLMRYLRYFNIEIHGEEGQPVEVIHNGETVKL